MNDIKKRKGKRGFDALKESRRWRIVTGKILTKMTFGDQQALLNRTVNRIFNNESRKPKEAKETSDR